MNVHEKYLNFLFKRKYDTLANMLRTSFCQFTSVRKYEELAKVAEETKKNFAAYERDDLKLREVSSSLYPLCLPSFYLSIYLVTMQVYAPGKVNPDPPPHPGICGA